ncbi:Effector-associated domain-containing protein [Candidatus Electrothrix laxa]
MPVTSDIQERHSEVQMLFAEDNLKEAVKRLMDFVRDFGEEDSEHLNEVIVISSNFNRLEKTERRGTLSYDEAAQRRNKLLYQSLGLMKEVIA